MKFWKKNRLLTDWMARNDIEMVLEIYPERKEAMVIGKGDATAYLIDIPEMCIPQPDPHYVLESVETGNYLSRRKEGDTYFYFDDGGVNPYYFKKRQDAESVAFQLSFLPTQHVLEDEAFVREVV